LAKIVVEDLVKRFGPTVAVDRVSLQVEDKEFFVLLGPSGCGKSTTLNMIAGLETQDQGHVYFDGELVDDLPPERRDVAMVFQSFALYPHMTAFQNIAFPLSLRKLSKDEIRKRVRAAAEMVGIERLLGRKPHELSGGERQRVALARAIVRQPRAFLLDEPLSNVDAKLRVGMRAELIRLQEQLGITTIYVTHDQVEAMTMADRIAVMDQGRVAQVDEPLRVFERPANLFVAGFVGSPSMNFFSCLLRVQDGQAYLESEHYRVGISPEVAKGIQGHADNSALVMGVRPQDISVSREKSGKESFHAKIYAVEPVGTETIVSITVGNQIVKSVAPPTFRAGFEEQVWVSVDSSKIHIYDRKSEKLIA
jgi:multiple sugar transport system ATP-binding protein